MSKVDRRILWIVLAGLAAVIAVAVANLTMRPGAPTQTLSYSALLDELEQGAFNRVELKGAEIAAQRRDGSIVYSYTPDIEGLVDALRRADVDMAALPAAPELSLQQMALSLGPALLFIAIMIVMMRRSSAAAQPAGLGKSRAKLLGAVTSPVRFSDVAGAQTAKQNLEEIVDFLRRPERYRAMGGRIPKGVLMVGPPGSGKTLLARALAGEAGVPFYAISGSDFVEMFVGIGASRVRDMFAAAKQSAPCIIFIDEIDAVGRHRGAGTGQGNEEREQTLNQLLVEMDGIDGEKGVVVMAATNRPDVLDPALVRSGRFDREVIIDHPDREARQQILLVHLRGIPTDTINVEALARSTPGLSGADLANMVNEAVLAAVRSGRESICMADLSAARDKVLNGDERRGALASAGERMRAGYRAAATALVALRSPETHPIDKVSIIPRGRAPNGLTVLDADHGSPTRRHLQAQLAVLVAARAAEHLVYGAQEVSPASAAGLAEATELARKMIVRWGMSEQSASLVYQSDDDRFLAGARSDEGPLSGKEAERVSAEIAELFRAAMTLATACVADERPTLDALAAALAERETLSGDEVAAIVAGHMKPMRQPA